MLFPNLKKIELHALLLFHLVHRDLIDRLHEHLASALFSTVWLWASGTKMSYRLAVSSFTSMTLNKTGEETGKTIPFATSFAAINFHRHARQSVTAE